jgi:hypothetical protein
VITVKELLVKVQVNDENKIVFMEPVKRATGKTVNITILTARLYTQDDLDREAEEMMQEGIHTYKREHGRVKQMR